MCHVLPSDTQCRAQESTADKADRGLVALMKHTANELARLTGPPPGPPKNTTLVQFRDPVLFYNSTAQLTQTLDVAQNLTERAKVHPLTYNFEVIIGYTCDVAANVTERAKALSVFVTHCHACCGEVRKPPR